MFRRRSSTGRPVPQSEPLTPAVAIVNADNFTAETEGGYTVVDFWAPWCGPCRRFLPDFQRVAEEHDGPVRFGTCDVEAYPEVGALLQITTVPTMVLFGPDGSEIGRVVGPPPRDAFEEMVAEVALRAQGSA